MRRTESCKFGHLGGTQIDRSAKAVEVAGYKQVEAKETLAVGLEVRVHPRVEGQVAARFGGKVVWRQVLAALAKQRVAAIPPGSVISDSASKVWRSGSAA